ncbi:hypothetical protein K9O30_07445 [Clostridium bowmanii]|uniref:hypothetical protein n=1 Tax=Clostridium bowmanii TaxID=132925 RepID=UPI001C0AA3F2|nr:hypothetical protein [Clostridium bowmanii]MBU3189591.1 hypothetical protein [Clostridium bowmanii]MCA1073566.1 hypothetical protein [Clostridium bowmanii]
MQNALIIFCLIIYYIAYKLCRVAKVSDCQELEDKLFLEIYVDKREEFRIEKSNSYQ